MRYKGFTLLELLVTLGLFAAIMGVLLSVFFQFKDQTARFESILTLRQEARILEHLLRQDLQSAVYLRKFVHKINVPGLYSGEERQSGIIGIDDQLGEQATDRLHMHVNRPARFFRGLDPARDPQLHEVSYFLVEEDQSWHFKRREQYYIDADMTDGLNSIVHTISQNVVGFDIRYYLPDRSEAIDEWGTDAIQREFENARAIPAGLEVSIELQSADGESYATQFQINLKPELGAGIEWKD